MKLKSTLIGNLNAIVKGEITAAQKAVTGGMRQATEGLTNELRGEVAKAGLGERLGKTWRGKVFPKSGVSINAAGFVYTRAPEILSSFAHGAVIRGKSGNYLAVPTKLVPRKSNKRMTPKDFETAGQKLVYVPPRGGRRVGLLVLENQRITSKGRARSASPTAIAKGRVATAVMFILVPQVTLKKRFDIQTVAEKWIATLPALVVANWPQIIPVQSQGEE